MIPPTLVDQIYNLEGSVPSLDFQLSVNNQKSEGSITILTPIMIRKIPIANKSYFPLYLPHTKTYANTSCSVHLFLKEKKAPIYKTGA
jgi:hypothetical protein